MSLKILAVEYALDPPPQGKQYKVMTRGMKVYHGFAQCLSCHPAYEKKETISAASLELVFGLFFLPFGVGYAASYLANRIPGQAASAGVVMLAALPVILGVQFLLQAMNFDVLNVPSRPIHPYLNVLRELETEE